MDFILLSLKHSWELLLEASICILFGIFVAGMLKVFLNPAIISKYLGKGRFLFVIKAVILGIPIPLLFMWSYPRGCISEKAGSQQWSRNGLFDIYS